jgi:Zn-dependent protease
VAAAGPLANLIMALIWVIIIKISLFMGPVVPMLAEFLINMGKAGIIINSILLVLNLFPVPPLDGSRIVMAFLPNYAARFYHKIEPYGLVVLLVLLLSGLLGRVLQPLVESILQLAQMLVR